jgi:DNA-binding PadR family transcriptional regulator
MRHCFEFFWPRADARVYSEAKGLVARGFVSEAKKRTGRRTTTSYEITPAGRRALASWLAMPPKPIALEFEALVKVFLGRFGSKQELLSTLAATGVDAQRMLDVATNVREVYLDRCVPFQDDYVHVWVFVYDFLTDYFAMVDQWADRTAERMASWEDLSPEGKREVALELFEAKRPGNRGPEVRPPADAVPGTWQRGRARPRSGPTSISAQP